MATAVYGLSILDEGNLSGSDTIFNTMAITVFLSVFAHGLTAYPGANWYGQKMSAQADSAPMPEMKPVPEVPARLPWHQR